MDKDNFFVKSQIQSNIRDIKMLLDTGVFDASILRPFQEPVFVSIILKLNDLLQKSGIIINEPKCNFDVEITMDILDDTEKVTAIMLFSGDSDLLAPLTRLKVKAKKIGIVGVRGMVAGELHNIKDKYFDFGKFYNGKRVYTDNKSENPAFGGTA